MAETNHEKDSLQIEASDKKDGKKTKFSSGAEFLEYEKSAAEKRRGDIVHGVSSKKKRKIPVWVDLFVSIMIILLVAGVIWGAVMLFDMYISDYEEKTIDYTLITDTSLEGLDRNAQLFYEPEDGEGNVVYMGKVQSRRELEDGRILLVVRLSVKYRPEDGYMNDEYRIAVGKDYKIKYGEASLSCEIVELSEVE